MKSTVKYVHELPLSSTIQLCDILDANRKWKELGKRYMKVKNLNRIGQAIYCGKSPTWELLIDYSERKMGTIKSLYFWLYLMDQQRAMLILKPYVDEKYHRLYTNENTSSTSLCHLDEEDITCSSLSQLFILPTSSLSQRLQGPADRRYTFGACGTSYKNEDENESDINQNCHSDFRRSKRLEASQIGPKVVSNTSPNLNQVQENTYSEKKSIPNKCALDKMKEERKLRNQEMSLMGKLIRRPHPSSGTNSNSQGDALPDFMKITYTKVCKATDNFDKARILGEGGFGIVYKGELSFTPVAIKRLIPKTCANISRHAVSLKQSLNELSILKCFRFDYILPLYAVSLDGNDPCLIYQLMDNGSLEDRLLCRSKTSPLTWSQRSRIAECTAKGLHYLHTAYEKPLVHGDIKSANILLDSNMEAKIGDFGLTRQGPGSNKTHVTVTSLQGTKFYLPDEYLRDQKLSPQVDIYSYGIVMFEVATGLRPYNSKTNKRLIDYVKACADIGTLDMLRDLKAGEENMLWFEELVKIGEDCSRTQKRDRTPMKDVLGKLEKINTEISKTKEISHNRVINAVHSATPKIKDEPLISKETEASMNNTEKSDPYALSESSSWSEELDNSKSISNVETSSFNRKPEAKTGVPPIPLVSILQVQVKSSDKDFNAREKMIDRENLSFVGKAEAGTGVPPIPLISILQAQVKNNDKYFNARENMNDKEALSIEGKAETETGVPPIPLLSILQPQMKSNDKYFNAKENMNDKEALSFEGKAETETGVPPIPLFSVLDAEVKNGEKELNRSEHKKDREASSSEGKSAAHMRVPPVPLLSFLEAEVPEFGGRSDEHDSEISLYYRSNMNL